MNWWLNIFFENDSIKMVFSIDLKIIKIDLDHLSKLEIIKSRIICPEGKDHDFSKMHFWASRESDHFLGVCDYSVTRWNYVFWEIWDLSDFGYYKRSSKSSISYLRVIEMDLNFQYFMVSFEIRNFTAWTVRHRTSNERNSYK